MLATPRQGLEGGSDPWASVKPTYSLGEAVTAHSVEGAEGGPPAQAVGEGLGQGCTPSCGASAGRGGCGPARGAGLSPSGCRGWVPEAATARGQTETTPRRALAPGRRAQKATMCSSLNIEPLLAMAQV